MRSMWFQKFFVDSPAGLDGSQRVSADLILASFP